MTVAAGDVQGFDIAPALDAGRWSGWQKGVIAMIASAIVLDGFDNQVLGFVVPVLLREWSITREALAPVFALGFVGMVLGTISGGALGDRVGRRPALILSVLVFGIATGFTALVNDVVSLGLCRTIAGFGLGGAMPCAATMLAEFAPVRKRSLAVTLGIVCVPVGGVVGGLIAARILPTLGWRALFVIGGAAPIVIAGLLLVALPESPRFLVQRPKRWRELAVLMRRIGHPTPPDATFRDSHEASNVARGSIAALFERSFRGDTIALWVAFFACLLVTYVIFSWAPALLAQSGFDLAASSLGLAIFNIGGVAGALGAAWATPRVGSRIILLGVTAGAVGGGAILAAMGSDAGHTPILAMLAIEGAFINAAQTGLYALAAHVYPSRLRSTGVGSAAGFGRIGAIISSFIGAAILAGGWQTYFVTVLIGMAACCAGIAVIRRHVVRDEIERIESEAPAAV